MELSWTFGHSSQSYLISSFVRSRAYRVKCPFHKRYSGIDKWLELSPYSSLRWVIIQLDEAEASGNWKTGYYFSPLIKVADVKKLLSLDHLGPCAFATEG